MKPLILLASKGLSIFILMVFVFFLLQEGLPEWNELSKLKQFEVIILGIMLLAVGLGFKWKLLSGIILILGFVAVVLLRNFASMGYILPLLLIVGSLNFYLAFAENFNKVK